MARIYIIQLVCQFTSTRFFMNRIVLLNPLYWQLKEAFKWNKDSMCCCDCSCELRLVVDFVPEGVLGDMFLAVYYFFETLLPWKWGPRVFRD